MKRRMIYGDEDAQALQGLQRHAKLLREGWDVVFLATGQAVLEALEEGPCDVLVASASLPDVTPLALLRQALQRHPACARILLTGSGSASAVLPCVGLLHQASPRSRDPHQVLAMLANAMHVSAGLRSHPELGAAIGSLERLPSMPQVFQELQALLETDRATWKTVGALIARDMGMTAKILKLVNSAFFGLQRRVDSAQDAVHFLGLDVIRALVLAHGIFDQTGTLATARITLGELWDHSLKVAKGSRALAAMEGLSRHQKADAFMGGLLHDVGILVLAKAFPEAYDRLLALAEVRQCSLVEAEERAFGLCHADVGAYLLGLWGIQPGVLEAVSLHHTPGAVTRTGFDHVLAVHVADEFSRAASSHRIWERTRLDDAALASVGKAECIPGWKRVLENPTW